LRIARNRGDRQAAFAVSRVAASMTHSIPLFCARHGISERFYFKLKVAGRGPAEMRLGNRVLISREAAVRWRAQREAE
jgi:hypothetical protein